MWQVLRGVFAPRVFIVPLFISEGYFSTQIIPKELGFSSVPSSINHQLATIHYCRPVGSHDSMTGVILARAAEVVKKFPFPRAPKPAETALFIADVHAIFMEEVPRISDCYQIALTKCLVVIPFFISDGLHTQEDIPILLGEAERIVKQRLAGGQPTWRNPTEKDDKLVWYSSAVGTEPLMAGVILERVREAASRNGGL